jgi:hypothetical protein
MNTRYRHVAAYTYIGTQSLFLVVSSRELTPALAIVWSGFRHGTMFSYKKFGTTETASSRFPPHFQGWTNRLKLLCASSVPWVHQLELTSLPRTSGISTFTRSSVWTRTALMESLWSRVSWSSATYYLSRAVCVRFPEASTHPVPSKVAFSNNI